jgi:hypothetical protein
MLTAKGGIISYVLVVLATIVCLPMQATMADTYTYTLDDAVSVWDVSGSYSEYDPTLRGTIYYDLTQDAAGLITGYGNADASISGVSLDMDFNITGSIKQSGGVATVKLSLKATGNVYIDIDGDGYDETIPFKASESIKIVIDEVSQIMTGKVKVCVSVKGYGSGCGSAEISLDLPYDMDGTSDLTLELDPGVKPNTVVGTGQLILSNGTTCNLVVTGKLNPNTQVLTATAKDPMVKSSKITIKLNDGNDTLTALSGKALGQSLKWKL